MSMHEERWTLGVAENGDVRLRDQKTGDIHWFGGRRALFDALGVLADWREGVFTSGLMSGPEQATMTVMVSPELVKQQTDWSEPVQIKITEIPYRPSACTHMIDIRAVTDKSHYGVPSGPITPGGWVPGCEIHGDACAGDPGMNSIDHAPDRTPHNADSGTPQARKLIGPAHAHLDAPCTDACYEPDRG